MRAEWPVGRHTYTYHARICGVTLHRIILGRHQRKVALIRRRETAPVGALALYEKPIELPVGYPCSPQILPAQLTTRLSALAREDDILNLPWVRVMNGPEMGDEHAV